MLHWVFCAWGVFYLLDGCAWLPSRYEMSHAGSPPSTAPPAVQAAGGHLSVRHREDLLEHAAGDAASAAHLRQFVDAEQRLSGRPLVAGNRVTLLVDGPATYQAMFDAMRVATDHIHLEAYELADDQIGQALADLVLARRAAGVHVKILYDSLGSRGSSAAYFERLRMGGVLVQEFHPVNPAKDLRVWRVIARDHRKLLIVDGKVAFTGGINFSRVYARGSSASTAKAQDTVRGWRDTTVRIEGPAVAEFQQLFLQNWTQGEPQQAWLENNFPPLNNVGPTLVRVVASAGEGQAYTIYKAYLAALGLAQQRIWVTQAYFTPTDAFKEALQAAAQRGVDVRILLPGVSDHPSVVYAAHAHYTALLKAGVQLYEQDDRILHAKTAVIDGIWSTVGSSNWDYLSFVHNDEANAVILGREFGQHMEDLFQQDLRHARFITLRQWQTRSLGERLMETLSLLFQYWF